MRDVEALVHRAQGMLEHDPRVRRWQVRSDGAIAIEIEVQGAVPPQDRYQIIESLGRPLYRVDRPEGSLDALLSDLVVVRVDVDGVPEPEVLLEPWERLGQINHQFWVDLWVTFGFVQRGKPWKAIKHMQHLRDLVFEVGRLASEDATARDEAVLPVELVPALARTSCGPQPAELGQALMYAIFVYRRMREALAARLQVAFSPEHEDRLITELVDVFGRPEELARMGEEAR
ncbi:MAG: hypothetical protein VKO21_12395 [Candidatus Sericytochromatia bacterium]|nr:hypothetical protein [Candidatus Sericytochromatia bacterium]